MTEPFIEWKNVQYSIRQNFFMRPLTIIKDLSLIVPKGSSIGILGANGAGKTTTLKLGAGIIHPDSGAVLFKDKPVHSSPDRSEIGFLTETQYIYPHLKVNEWLKLMGTLSGLTSGKLITQCQKVIEQFDLKEKSNALLHTLSKGELQRAGFAQAFLHSPEFLILDEPMSGMDPFWRSRIKEILIEFKKEGGTLIFSSHILSDVLRLTDEIVIIDSGQIKWKGSMYDLPGVNNTYQIVFRANDLPLLKQSLELNTLESYPDGSYLATFHKDYKQDMLKLAIIGKIEVLSLSPEYSDFKRIISK